MLKTVIEILSLSPLWQWLSLSQKKDAVRYVIARSTIIAAESKHDRKISPEGAIIDKKLKNSISSNQCGSTRFICTGKAKQALFAVVNRQYGDGKTKVGRESQNCQSAGM